MRRRDQYKGTYKCDDVFRTREHTNERLERFKETYKYVGVIHTGEFRNVTV